MEILETSISGCFEIRPKLLEDIRGWFLKTYHRDQFKDFGLGTQWNEEYFSSSQKDVLRGVHFQTPPDDHYKIVTCLNGSVVDVIVDLRKNSPTFRKCISLKLNGQNKKMVYIPKGCGHAFLSMEDNSILFYKVSSVYSPEKDKGVLWSSLDFDWSISNPILSPRDMQHPKINSFNSPF